MAHPSTARSSANAAQLLYDAAAVPPLPDAVVGDIELQLLLDSIFAQELAAMSAASPLHKVLRDVMADIQQHYVRVTGASPSAGVDAPARPAKRGSGRAELSDEALTRIADAVVRQPLLCALFSCCRSLQPLV